MTSPELTERERLAAEYALRLLAGEELVRARGMVATDPDFAGEVAAWEEQLAPLHDQTAPTAPGAEIWSRIEAEISGNASEGEIISLRRKLRSWQLASIVSAAAAVLLAFLAMPGMREPPPLAGPDAPLMANIPIANTDLRLAVTYLPDRGEMLVSASGLTSDGVHDHELWLVPDEGELRSLGVVKPGQQMGVMLDKDTARLIGNGSRMVLTREPIGGKPENSAAGPVVAEGAFTVI